MATSGSANFSITRNELIQEALELLGAYGAAETISAEDMTKAARALNLMVKTWQAQGLHLWAQEEGVLFIDKNVSTYTLSNDASSANACLWSDAVLTQIATAASASDTTLTVDSTTGMAASDIIGIVLDDGTVDYTTIVSVDSSTALTITTGLSAAAAVNKNVYTFTSRINKPLRIHNMRQVTGISSSTTSSNNLPMTELSQEDYAYIAGPDTNGRSSHFYYNPDLTTGKLYLWPRPNDGKYYFKFSFTRMLEDFDASTDNPDFPIEWAEALIWNLAARLAPAFGKEDKAVTQIIPYATALLNTIAAYDAETVSFNLQPNGCKYD